MNVVWKHLRPVDKFSVELTNALSMFQIKTVAQLYQPVIGSTASALYMTLVSEVEGDSHFSRENNHQWLMNVMGLPLDQIYRARLRLEAIGLLKTYRLQHGREGDEGDVCFKYQLLPPLSPNRFFADDVLSICLFNQVGTRRYRQLRARYIAYYKDQDADEHVEQEELTQPFHEVFQSIHTSELAAHSGSEIHQELETSKKMFAQQEQDAEGTTPNFSRYELDLDMLKSFFMKGLNADGILLPHHVQEIKKLAFLYRLDEFEMSRLIQDSLTVDDQLDVSRLKANAKEWYRIQHGGKPPRVIDRLQPPQKRVMKEEALATEEERHLYKLETLSPLQLLEAYQGGGKVAEADINLVEELLFDYQLEPAVVNLLVEYILLTNEFKLPRNLVTKVAAHWRRLNIKDVRQAQELAKKEHRQYKAWQKKKEEQGTAPRSRQTGPFKGSSSSTEFIRRDTLPKWIEAEETASTVDDAPDHAPKRQSSALSDSQKRKRMKALLKALGEADES